MRKRRDYLYQRPGSQNWYVRVQRSDGTCIAKSLGTPDRQRAAVLAAPLIASHKQYLLDNRPRIVMLDWSRFLAGDAAKVVRLRRADR